ncbi:MAG: RpiR family transcriptional regulator, carbohydrate utilization regulator [Acetobacterium sp.]|nr:RpiR family transcriptional regulator, carbohydrate utilization regulator [Acetobacterium sp.]
MIQNQDCRLTISQLYPTLHKIEKNIADFILANPDDVINMTIAQFAAQVNSAESSVVRFCQRLDIKGFSQLKINLAQNTVPNKELIYGEVAKTDSIETVLNKIFSSSIQVLENTRKFIDIDSFNKTIELLHQAVKIDIYGVYTSSFICQDAYTRLYRIGYPAHAFTDPYEANISASMLGKGSVALGISHTGRTKDTVDILKRAKASGADTIAITSTMKSPIVEVADISLVICSDEQQIFREAVSSRLAHIVLLDAICTCLGLLKYDETLERIKENISIINEMRY